VFRAWGRIGTTVGGNKVEKFGSKANAIGHFKDLYLDKTANHWENKNDFKKHPNKFFPLDIDYGAVSFSFHLLQVTWVEKNVFSFQQFHYAK